MLYEFSEPPTLLLLSIVIGINEHSQVLQVLIALPLFWTFLDQVGKRATHSFKNETPLLEAMIMFMREFKIIDSAISAEQLRLRLKDNELEQYGEPFAPEFVYEVIRRLPRFSSMRVSQPCNIV